MHVSLSVSPLGLRYILLLPTVPTSPKAVLIISAVASCTPWPPRSCRVRRERQRGCLLLDPSSSNVVSGAVSHHEDDAVTSERLCSALVVDLSRDGGDGGAPLKGGCLGGNGPCIWAEGLNAFYALRYVVRRRWSSGACCCMQGRARCCTHRGWFASSSTQIHAFYWARLALLLSLRVAPRPQAHRRNRCKSSGVCEEAPLLLPLSF